MVINGYKVIFLLIFIVGCKKEKDHSKSYDIFVNSSTIEVDKTLTYKEIIMPKAKSIKKNNINDVDFSSRNNFNHSFNEELKLETLNFDLQLFHKQKLHYFSAPILYNNNLINVDLDGKIVSFNLETKKINWSYKVAKTTNIVNFKLTLHNGFLFASTSNGLIVKLDLENGNEIEFKKFKEEFFTHLICENKFCYVSNGFDTLYKINIENLEIVRKHNKISMNNYLTFQASDPLIYDDFVFYVNSSNYIICLDKSNFKEIWTFKLSYNKSLGAFSVALFSQFNPIIYKDILIFGNPKVFSVGLNPKTGELLWMKNFGINSQITAIENYILFVDDETRLILMDCKTGGIKWFLQLEKFKSYDVPKYLNYGTNISVPILYSSIFIANDKIFLPNYFGELLTIDINEGKVLNKIEIPNFINGSMLIFNNSIYMLNAFNAIYKMK
jgi:outer membrane protein assembly factor BamB